MAGDADDSDRLPESSRTGRPPGPHPFEERQRRRAAVEQALLFPFRGWAEKLAVEFSASVRTIRQDARRVQRQWMVQDARLRKSRRAQALRRYELFLRKAVNADLLTDATRIQARIDRITGLEAPEQDDGTVDVSLE